jgi:hypothetical protein
MLVSSGQVVLSDLSILPQVVQQQQQLSWQQQQLFAH